MADEPSGSEVMIDLNIVLNKMSDDNARLSFLENLRKKVEDNLTSNPKLKPLLWQIASALSPIYIHHNRTEDAAKLFESAGVYDQAAVNFMKVRAFGDAGRCYSKNGEHEKALQLYTQAEMWLPAAEIADQTGNPTVAKNLYSKAIEQFTNSREYEKAAYAAEKAGLVKETLTLTADHIDHIGNKDSKFLYQELVERALKANFRPLAIELAIRGELFDQAIQMAIQDHQTDQVPEIYQQYLNSLYPKERMPVFKRYISFLTEHATVAVVRVAYQKEVRHLIERAELLSAGMLAEEAKLPEAAEIYRQAMEIAESNADFAQATLAATKLGLASEANYYRQLASMIG
ncbi:MAG: hypothetical protein WC773_00045 [Patescibacteria group bacterium]|jgi:tetratricopeptide (TPR) repeat protein